MNRKYMVGLISQMFREQAGDGDQGGGGGGGGSGDQTVTIKPDEARAAIADYVLDPEQIKTMPDADVVKYHEKISGATKKALDGLTAKQQAERLEAAKTLKIDLPKDSKLVQTDIDRISAIVREKGLSKAEADVLVAEANATAVAVEARMQESAKQQQQKWQADVKADPEIGGDKFSVTQRNSQRVLDTFMPNGKDEAGNAVIHPLRNMLRETGFGDHPEVVKFLNRVGSAMAEDKPMVGAGGGGGGNKDAAAVLYGDGKT